MPYKDKEKQREACKNHYKQHKKEYVAYGKKRRKWLNAWFANFKSKQSCQICQENRAPALHFHHVQPKEKNYEVYEAVRNGKSVDNILDEINKCIVLCCRCHKLYHSGVLTEKEMVLYNFALQKREEKIKNGEKLYEEYLDIGPVEIEKDDIIVNEDLPELGENEIEEELDEEDQPQ